MSNNFKEMTPLTLIFLCKKLSLHHVFNEIFLIYKPPLLKSLKNFSTQKYLDFLVPDIYPLFGVLNSNIYFKFGYQKLSITRVFGFLGLNIVIMFGLLGPDTMGCIVFFLSLSIYIALFLDVSFLNSFQLLFNHFNKFFLSKIMYE